MNRLPLDRQIHVISLLCEGNGIRSTERLTGVHRDTIMRLTQRVGDGCHRLHHARMRDLQPARLELDETWSCIRVKQKNIRPDHPVEYGDCYTWVGLDADKRTIVSYWVGKRSAEDAEAFVADLRHRVVNRPQIVTDAYQPYEPVLAKWFGGSADYVMLNKKAGNVPVVIRGRSDAGGLTTNHVERVNLTLRAHLRRCTRRTTAISKKKVAHQAAIALGVGFYNWCRVHETLRVTPAMEMGLTDHIWSIAELLREAEAAPPIEPIPPPPAAVFPRPGRRLFRIQVSRGRKMG